MSAKYKKIFRNLLDEIKNEKYKTGDVLPGEHELMDIYGVSRDTIRKALSLLENEGVITKQQGKGSVVIDSGRFDFPVSGIESFKELHDQLGDDVETIVVCLEKCGVDERIAKILNMQLHDEVWLLQRVRKIDGEKVILDTDFINASIVKELPKEQMEDSLYKYLEEDLGLKIVLAKKEITCEAATGMDEKYLDMVGYDMVVNVESTTYLEDGRVFQFTIARHRPDKFRFVDFAKRTKI